MTSESRTGKPGKMMKKEKPMMSVTAIIQGTQAQHWARGNTCTYVNILLRNYCATDCYANAISLASIEKPRFKTLYYRVIEYLR